ncbi:unnamed protein product [Effrenium voratum]|uniref:Mannose-P-dolichol utilization defect 1 protein homolog n=1 Tax=Effrenium voratum TaxID=2562239 RepID=A0AA36JQW7_9DINO|nr:unnamed protein product [Effrenium voratum]
MSVADVAAAWLGYAVIAGACIVKVPQIYLMVKFSSAEGLSEVSCALDAIAASSFSYYNLLKGYPLAGWGEQAIVAVQATAVVILVWVYRAGTDWKSRTFGLLLWILASVAIILKGHDQEVLLLVLGTAPTFLTAISRVPQIMLNWQTQQTGHLSAITFFLQFLGSVARFLTTLQLLGSDTLSLVSHAVGAILNLVVVLQILAYDPDVKSAVRPVKPPVIVPISEKSV